MASYNEVTHNKSVDCSILDPMFKWDVHFPDHISRLTINEDFHHNRSSSQKRRGGRGRTRNTNRYKTQPITFDEIKEVDEEKTSEKSEGKEDKEKEGLKSQFTAFSRSMDGLVPGYPGLPRVKNPPLRPSPLIAGAPTTGPTPPQSPGSKADGAISLSIRVPERFANTSTNPSSTPGAGASNMNSRSAEMPPPSGAELTAATTTAAADVSTSVGVTPKVTNQELSAIGLKAMPDLPQDSSRARRAKRRQKKLIEEEPEGDAASKTAT